MVSFAVILVNSLTITVIRFAQRRVSFSSDSAADSDVRWKPSAHRVTIFKSWYILPNPRSPPCRVLE
jgi:hypothetical protein